MMTTGFQIFCIGFGLSAGGPCLVSCLPVLLAFTTGKGGGFRTRVGDILVFLSGRFLAYVLLGAIAGVSAAALQRIVGPSFSLFARPLAGLISIGLGVALLFPRTEKGECALPRQFASGGILFAGFATGMSPCGPLLALLSEIMLISKNAWQGAWYGAAFGLGTFIPSFIITAGISGILYRLTGHRVVPANARFVTGLTCGIALIAFGIWFIWQAR